MYMNVLECSRMETEKTREHTNIVHYQRIRQTGNDIFPKSKTPTALEILKTFKNHIRSILYM